MTCFHQANFPHSKEARLAQDQEITYCDALSSIHDRREAFSNARPFSARIIGQGNSFCYRQGVLCILEGSSIRISDVHASSAFFEVDLSPFINTVPEASTSPSEPKISLLHYNDEIVTVHYEKKARPNNGRIFVISTKLNPPGGKRVIKEIQLESSYKLFARHTASYLYYGTYTGMGEHGHHEWEIRGVSLDRRHPLKGCARPLQLEEFFGTDVGSTIAFEVHNGYFYAVSNQTSFEVEELDWTSFYHCVRFPLDRPKRDFMDINKKVYRRQHAEGPIHDSWTDLTIQFDECTDEPMIVESRREWQKGSSRQLRTFYISDFDCPEKCDSAMPSADGSPAMGASDAPLLPEDDPFTELLDSTNRPNYAPTKPRFNWNFHPEFPSDCGTTRSFILARTKFRAYNYACSSFLDLVEDERCCNNPATPPCLRIRIGSRRVAPFDWTPADKTPPPKDKSLSPLTAEDDVVYRHSSINMWPPPASRCPCSKRLHQILNPPLPTGPAYNRSITGVLDERSLVYMIRSGRSYGSNDDNALGPIVMISFNRGPLPPKPNDKSPDHEEKMEDEFNPSHWQWTPGLSTACKSGTCR